MFENVIEHSLVFVISVLLNRSYNFGENAGIKSCIVAYTIFTGIQPFPQMKVSNKSWCKK